MKNGSLTNHLLSNSQSQSPQIGMGVTECLYSDRQAYTIINILSKTRIMIQKDIATRSDKKGMSELQEYTYARNEHGSTKTLSLRKDGRWRAQGEGNSSAVYVLGLRDQFHDYSF
jgi:hypothetical protein